SEAGPSAAGPDAVQPASITPSTTTGGRRCISAQLAAAPHDDGAGGCRRADGGETLGQSDGGALGRRPRPRQGRTGALELLAEGGGVLAQRCDLPFELQDAADALQPDAAAGELGDLPQLLDVVPGVAAATAAGATRAHQPHPVVLPQGLRVQAAELSGHAAHIDRDGGLGHARGLTGSWGHHAPPMRFRLRSLSAVASRYASSAARASALSVAGTCTSTVTSRSP